MPKRTSIGGIRHEEIGRACHNLAVVEPLSVGSGGDDVIPYFHLQQETSDLATCCPITMATYDAIPETMMLRELRFHVSQPGRRTTEITVATTLTDANVYSTADLAELYGFRWNAELDIRSIQQNLNLNHVRCKSPEMVRRELWTTLLAYHLVRTAAAAL